MSTPAPALKASSTQQSIQISAAVGLLLIVLPFIFFDLDTAVVILSSGLYQGMLFFLVAAGLSIVFGLLDVLNFAQGSFFMLGAYVGFAVYGALPEGTPIWLRFFTAIVAAVIAVAALGAITEVALLRPLYSRPIYLIVLTFGLASALNELVIAIYGPAGLVPIDPPPALDGSVVIFGGQFEVYRFFVVGVGALLMVGIALLLQRTRLGIVIRAGVQDSEMVQALGINIRRIFTLVFVLGAAVAALGGITAAPYIGAYPTMGSTYFLTAIIVIVIGGMSSFEGTAVAAMLLGLMRALIENLSLQYFDTPVLATISALVFMVIVLLVRPTGLFGRE